MKLVTRTSLGWPKHPRAGKAPCKNGIVLHYDGSRQNLAGKAHSACVQYWRNTRAFHMGPSRGWNDLGYSFGICPHGYVFEGRGFGYQQAAQPGGNSTWTSCTFMSGEGEQPTSAQLRAFQEFRAWLRGKGVASRIRGHRDFISTSCPGSVLYKLVTNTSSALYKSAAVQNKEDDMPEYISAGKKDNTQALPPSTWVTVNWEEEYSDRYDHHADKGGPAFLSGPARYACTVGIRIKGLTPGTELQARVIEVPKSGKPASGPIAEYVASKGDTFIKYDIGADTVPEGRTVQFQVIHYGTETGTIVSGSVKAHAWPT